MALDSILSTPIIPAPPKSANPASPDNSGPGSSPGAGPAAGHAADNSSSARGTDTSHGTGQDSSNSSSKGTGSRGSATSGKANAAANSRSKQSASGTHATGSTATKKAGTKGGSNAQQGNDAPASFLQALAQSQADATVSVDPAATQAPQELTWATDKDKPASSGDSDASTSSLAFISQSLAAAIAGVQQPNAPQPTAAAADSTDEGDATEALSAARSGGAGALQSLVANLAKDTADGLKATTDATNATNGSKSAAGSNSASGIDDASAAVNAFQAHMSVGSHFQSVADTTPNKVDSPVGSPAFNDELGGKVTWLANQGIQSASLQLSPEHLGPVNVHISVQDGAASVSFNAAHADTRAALEQALPRLREMFATNGLTLSDANVSHQSPRGQAQKQSISAIGGIGGAGDVSEDTTSSSVSAVVNNRPGLVDTYA